MLMHRAVCTHVQVYQINWRKEIGVPDLVTLKKQLAWS